MSAVRVSCRQLAPEVGDVDGNRERAREAVRAAVDEGARRVVLPELCTSGYVFASPEEARATAQAAHGGALEEWAQEAARGGAIVVGGFCELGAGDVLHNSAAMVGPEGVLAVYRKTHLWDREKLFFAPGADPPPVLDTPLGRIGMAICYDTSFPELMRGLALRGAELLAIPTNNPAFPRPDGQDPLELTAIRAHAYFNRVFVACCDRVGEERGVPFLGSSIVTDEQGWALATAPLGRTAAVTAECDLAAARDKRWGERNDVFGDRRPELYGDMAPPH